MRRNNKEIDAGTLTAADMAHALGVSLRTVHRTLDREGIPRTGRGHPRIAPRATLDKLVTRRVATPPSSRSRHELLVLSY